MVTCSYLSDASSPTKSPEELQADRDAIDSIVPDLPQDEEHHLDLDLQEEAQFLSEYQTLLASTGMEVVFFSK